ncbi:glycoside hydrolase family 18 protein [Annulohypoxylon bovei var. microspora]|nr:glycoside hydrolase family 18 protein [Annulohypoxylon bovei var. microspora]
MVSFTLALAAFASILPSALAAFDASTQTNVAVYWGQNSLGQATSQTRLADYCSNTEIDIIPLAFMDGITTPTTNFANAGDNCTVYAGTSLLNCPQLETDIKACQSQGKTILLSLGGATYTEGGFSSSSAAETAAQNVWNLFGSDTTQENRPFLTAVVDGFDFDLESTNQNFAPFATELRSLMDTDTSKTYYLSAAPQCPYPDAADNDMLNGVVPFDFIMIQFYNNYCGVSSYVAGSTTQNNFNFETWDDWAKNTSKNKDVKIFLGVPANTGAGGGYVDASTLSGVIQYSKTFSSFGGVMMWDMSQLYANSGFLDAVYSSLSASSSKARAITTLVKKTKPAPTQVA